MRVTCGNVTKLPYANQMQLVAGREGADNEIRWVHYLEEPKYVEWLKGGELIIISGVVTADHEDLLLELMERLFEKNAAGVVINLSCYIRKIPQAVLDYGDRMGFPIFEMPARVRIVDVSQSVCLAIFKNQKYDSDAERLMEDALLGRRLTRQRTARFENLGYEDARPYRVVIFRTRGQKETADDLFYEENAVETLLQNLKGELKRQLPAACSAFLCVVEEQVVWMADGSIAREELTEYCAGGERAFPETEWYVGVSERFTGLQNLRRALVHGETAADAAGEQTAPGPVFYEDMIDSRLFSYVPDQQEKRQMAQQILGPLLEPRNQELLRFAEMYFRCDCNVRRTAEALYLHVNTAHHRLEKICRLLQRDLSRVEDRFRILLALKLLRAAERDIP